MSQLAERLEAWKSRVIWPPTGHWFYNGPEFLTECFMAPATPPLCSGSRLCSRAKRSPRTRYLKTTVCYQYVEDWRPKRKAPQRSACLYIWLCELSRLMGLHFSTASQRKRKLAFSSWLCSCALYYAPMRSPMLLLITPGSLSATAIWSP